MFGFSRDSIHDDRVNGNALYATPRMTCDIDLIVEIEMWR
jgi:hypothetical protein